MTPTLLTPPPPDTAAVSTDQLKLILDVSRMLAVTTDLDALLTAIANACCRLLHCDRASIWFHDPGPGELWTKVATGSAAIRIPAFAGVVGAAFTGNRVLNVPDPQSDPRFNAASDRKTGFVTRSLLAAPMQDSGEIPVGVVQAVNKIGGAFSPTDISLIRLLADQAGVAVQRYRLEAAALQSAEFDREMTLARRVQDALLPKTIPTVPGFDIAGWARPASRTGGDCYDLWPLADGRIGVLLADASGHGIAAALVVSQVRSLARICCDVGDCDPHRILWKINRRLSEDLDPSRFVTAFLGFLSPDGRLDYQSAGHGPLFHRPHPGDAVQCLDATTTPLNAVDDLPGESPDPLHIHPGGTFTVLSDGIFEAFNPAGVQYDPERVVTWLDRTAPLPAAARLVELRIEMDDWQHTPVPTDDQTAVVIHRR